MEYLVLLFTAIVVGIGMRLLFCLPAAFIVKWCWNGCIPFIFHMPEIKFWQSYALCLLIGMLTAQTGLTLKK